MTDIITRSPPAVLLRMFLPFAAGYFLSYLYRTINAVLSPHLVAELGLDATDLGLLTSVYFLTFAAFQLPLGMLLDRFGPRRVEATLLLFAAAGAGLFAVSSHATELIIGRALIGLGVSACLMASFKAFVLWFPAARLPAVNGWLLAAGGLGALVATAPVEAALRLTDWRGLFVILAGLSFAVAAALLWVVPERSGGVRQRELAGAVACGDRDFPQPGVLAHRSGFGAVPGVIHGHSGTVGGTLAARCIGPGSQRLPLNTSSGSRRRWWRVFSAWGN